MVESSRQSSNRIDKTDRSNRWLPTRLVPIEPSSNYTYHIFILV